MTCDPLTSLPIRVIEHENSDEITIEWGSLLHAARVRFRLRVR